MYKRQSAGSVQAAAEDTSGDLYVFIAASLNNAMEEIQKDFNEDYPDVNILYNADSSGTLQTQIEEGSRCDIFFSAATKQMDALVDEELAKKDSVVDLLENKVVLIKPKGGETKVTGFENITDAANIALAGEDVPVGQYAREIFKNLGIEDDVNKMEINEGKNVTEVLASVSEGSNEVGIVYATDAASVADKVDIIAEAPEGSLKTPVLYPVGLTEDKEASDSEAAAADAFLAYLQTDEALKVFEEYGFTPYKAEEKAEDAEEKHLYATIIEENNKLLLQLISDILDLSKIEAGTFDIIPEQVDAQQLCNELLQSMQVRATEQVEILLAPELPELTFTSDKNRLYQVLLNFVTNALKFTSEGSIVIDYRINGNEVRFSVQDTGMGIEPEKQEAIFTRFVKLNNFIAGTGLGLPICQSIVTQLGGKIGVESEPGKGSCFWFTHPIN